MKPSVTLTETGKICTRCSRDLPLAEYYAERTGTLGLKAECKDCWAVRTRKSYDANRERKAVRDKKWREANPERMSAITRRSNLRRKYGITVEDYEAMLTAQGGRCAGCSGTDSGDRRFETFHVDHDHQTGKIRGLLCASCNRALGVLNDDPDRLVSLAAYLFQHSDVLAGLTVEVPA